MTLDELRHAVGAKEIDTVVLAMTDMQGRLQGKRFTARHFLDAVLGHSAEGCNYLLAVDVDMNTVDGYAMASWDQGYGDFVMVPDLSTLRRTPWLPGTALLLADLQWHDHTPVVASPRQILRAQIDRLAARGWTALAATELEFMLFSTSYRDAHLQGYRDLEPANFHNIDYSILGTSRVEPLIRRIRNEMLEAGLVVENSKGECNFGQHEINFLYDEVLATADKHAVYKNGAKEIADQEGMAISFMAKYDQREGSSCHVHLSLRDGADAPVFADEPQVFDAFMAGLLATLPELTLLHAPNINSYKRFASASFAPTAVAWGTDNRTCALRVLGEGKAPPGRAAHARCGRQPVPDARRADRRRPARRRARAAARAAGDGQRLRDGPPRVPGTLRDARDLFAGQRRRAVGVRRRRRRALPQRRPGRAGGLRRGGDRLGARARLRAPLADGRHRARRASRWTRSSRPCARRRRSRRRSTGWGPRSSSGCCGPEPSCRPSASCARGWASRGRRCARRSPRSPRAGTSTRSAGAAAGRSSPTRCRRPTSPGTTCSPAGSEVCDLRLAIEFGAVALACQRADPEALAPLAALVESMDDLLDDYDAFRPLDVRFHIGLAEASGSARLIAAMTEAQGEMTDLISHIPHPQEVLLHSNEQHAQILAAVRAGDAARAIGIVADHLHGTEHVLAGLLPQA